MSRDCYFYLTVHLNLNNTNNLMYIIVYIPKPQPNSRAKLPEPLHESYRLIELKKYEISQMIDSWYLVRMAHSHEGILCVCVCVRACSCVCVL